MVDPNFRLTKGTLIDSQQGFVDAFNYVYENINGLKGGQNAEIDKSIDGAWQINVNEQEYTDESSGGSGEVTLSGTDSSSHTGNEFKFASVQNSNISVMIDATGNITFGCYYI